MVMKYSELEGFFAWLNESRGNPDTIADSELSHLIGRAFDRATQYSINNIKKSMAFWGFISPSGTNDVWKVNRGSPETEAVETK